MPIYISNNKLFNNKVLYKAPNPDITIIKNHINSSTQAKLVNKNANTDRLVYSTQDPYYNNVGQFVRNPTCWLNGVANISCFSPAQLSSAGWSQGGGTLITKKHLLFAKHYRPSILSNGGTPIIFVDENNNVIRRNLISYSNDTITDISIGLLDNEVPANIKIAKVLPIDYNIYISLNFSAESPILCVCLDQQEKALVKEFYGLQTYGYYEGETLISYKNVYIANITNQSAFSQYTSFSETIISGDSGNPIFFIIDNELVVLSTWHTPTTGPFITDKYGVVNNLINGLSPNEGYSLTPINLSNIYNNLA